MRITTDLFILFWYFILVRLVSSKQIFTDKKMNQTSRPSFKRIGPPVIPNQNVIQLDRSAYPEPLPTEPPRKVEPTPYKTIYQGVRYKDDMRVFRKRFEYEAELTGQQIVCQGLFDCIISHIAIESTEAIPVLLRGGAGYRHFTAVVKAKPHHDLKGQVRAYCRNKYAPLEDSKKSNLPQRRFDFGDKLDEDNFT